ncbi:uncharacterized protein LOC119472358 [Cebus imitator]|uniref:uncharacterized protein LOC119472358 n=1 Tax=Cebus imitator TaxID=2715852 RepID=UPI001896C11D|nr:uncharacterized protein LOC119472358 [Cebus imitator]
MVAYKLRTSRPRNGWSWEQAVEMPGFRGKGLGTTSQDLPASALRPRSFLRAHQKAPGRSHSQRGARAAAISRELSRAALRREEPGSCRSPPCAAFGTRRQGSPALPPGLGCK